MILDESILQTVRAYAEKIQHPVGFKIYGGSHAKRGELSDMLEKVASVSENLSVQYSNTDASVREGLTFEITARGEPTGVLFSGIPGGHEFNSFILAMLQAGGHTIKLDEAVQRQIRAIDRHLSFESIISLDCHVCPDVVQTFNQMALLNPKIRHEMIDGGLHQSLTDERKVQGVPAVFLDKKPFANGAVSVTEILEKIGGAPASPPAASEGSEPENFDVAVIGGGPAAISAAIYTARKGLKVVLLAEKIGGQLNDTLGIENFISVAETTGPKLTGDLRGHLEAYPVRIREEIRVRDLGVRDDGKKSLLLSTGETLQASTVIVATGARWRELGVPGEKENVGRGVAYCPHCDGPFFKGKNVTVVGGGNSGVEAALDLAGIAKSVTVLEFLDEFKADRVLLEKLEATANVSSMTGIATESIEADDSGVTAMNLVRRASSEKFRHSTDGVFVQIGLVPNSAFVRDVIALSKYGEVLVNDRCETNVPGIFACGDVTDVPYKQIIIAMGEGAKAGLSAFEYLLKSVPAK
jgi:alkyl hydroperoxide reductase subunit F